MTDQEWMSKDRQAWEAVAARLESEGYSREPDDYYPAIFCKDGEELALTRPLGTLNWIPHVLHSGV